MTAPDGILLIDKPAGITSHDVVDHVRRRFGIRRVGHTGTLDPAATGLLILLLGHATRQARFFLESDKSYLATLSLGITTDTLDAQGQVLKTHPVGLLTPDQIESVCQRFRGEIEQLVPAYSAVQIQGRRSYALARAGIAIPPTHRKVIIHRLEILGIRLPEVDLEISCSKGTYIRSLCADIGEALGCGGHLKALRRTRIGSFSIEQAVKLEEAALQNVFPLEGVPVP